MTKTNNLGLKSKVGFIHRTHRTWTRHDRVCLEISVKRDDI